MSHTHSGVKRLTISLLSLILLFNLSFPAHAATSLEDTSFALHPSSDGFYGSYTVGGVEYLYGVTKKRQMQETRIQRNNGEDIASCVLNKNMVTVIFAGVSITFNLSMQSISALETSEVAALRDFGAGNEAQVTRDVITNIMTRSDQVLLTRIHASRFIVSSSIACGDEHCLSSLALLAHLNREIGAQGFRCVEDLRPAESN